MSEENSYTGQTGQVAPVTQNPQAGSSQPYQQQTAEGLQSGTNKLLEGQSGVVLVLPNGSSVVAPSGRTAASTVIDKQSDGFGLVVPIFIAITTFIIFLGLIKFIFSSKKQKSPLAVESETSTKTEEVKEQKLASSSDDLKSKKKLASKKKSKKSKHKKKK